MSSNKMCLCCSKNAILLIQETNLKWIEGNSFVSNTYLHCSRGHHFGRGELSVATCLTVVPGCKYWLTQEEKVSLLFKRPSCG